MNLFVIFLCLFVVFIEASSPSPWDNRTITIAVVEYQPIRDPSLSPQARIMGNADQYLQFIQTIDEPNVDMIIFPEDTLRNDPHTAVEVGVGDAPCDSPDDGSALLMRRLSCAARNASAYLIVNLVEKEKCDGSRPSRNCQKYGFFYYNTDVVFDRQGHVAAKYRKYNLFGEIQLDKPEVAEEVVFRTDFGEDYGIFTCFDILFKSPAQDLLKKNVDGVVFPTMWFSELPFLTALQTQQMWAHAHDVKMFSAGANNPPAGSGGSGFYSGAQGMILGDIIADGGSKSYVYKYVPGEAPDYNPQQPTPYEDPDALALAMDSFNLSTDSSIKEYKSTVLDTSGDGGDVKKELCYENGTENRLCCDFTVRTNVNATGTGNKSSYVYHLVAFSGVRSFKGTYNGGLELCAVIACLNSSLSSCGLRFPNYTDVVWPITFEQITIRANFDKNENKTQYPNSLLSSIRPINASQTVWKGKEVEVEGRIYVERSFSLTEPQNRLLTFAIYGRNFGQDSPPIENDNSSVKSMDVSWFLMAVVIVLSVVKLNL